MVIGVRATRSTARTEATASANASASGAAPNGRTGRPAGTRQFTALFSSLFRRTPSRTAGTAGRQPPPAAPGISTASELPQPPVIQPQGSGALRGAEERRRALLGEGEPLKRTNSAPPLVRNTRMSGAIAPPQAPETPVIASDHHTPAGETANGTSQTGNTEDEVDGPRLGPVVESASSSSRSENSRGVAGSPRSHDAGSQGDMSNPDSLEMEPGSPRSVPFETSSGSSLQSFWLPVLNNVMQAAKEEQPDDFPSNEFVQLSRSPSPELDPSRLSLLSTQAFENRVSLLERNTGGSDGSVGGSTHHNASSHHDASAELTPRLGRGDEREFFQDFHTRSSSPISEEVREERSGGTPHAGSVPPGGSDETLIPADPRDGDDLAINAHRLRHRQPFAANRDSTVLGLHTTSRPPGPMALPLGGPRQRPVPHATPATAGALDAPRSARAELGIRKDRARLALGAISKLLIPQSMRGSGATTASRTQANAANILPAMTNYAALDAHVDSLFRRSGGDAGELALGAQIRIALGASGPTVPTRGHRTELLFTHHMLIAERLAQVTGGDRARATAAFEALRQRCFLPFSSVPASAGEPSARLDELLTLPSGRASRGQAELDALSVAAKLASSVSGFEALVRTMQPSMQSPTEPLPEDRLPHLRKLLEAVGKVESERGAVADVANHFVAARSAMETGQATLAQHVLHIESRALEHVGADPYASLDVKDKAAIFSWDNGFRDRGPGTELAKVQGRLAKMSKYVQRANHRQTLRNVRFDKNEPLRSSAKVIDAKARILAMRAQQTIGRKKSPFTGLRKFGANNNLLKHPDDDIQVVDDNAETVVRTLRARYRELFGNRRDFATQLLDPHAKRLPEPVLHEALLEHWESLIDDQQMRPLGNRLDGRAIKVIAQRIATNYGVDTAPTRALIESHLRSWAGTRRKGWSLERKVDRELGLRDLQTWAEAVHMPMRWLTPLGQEVAGGSPAQEASARLAIVPEEEVDETASAGSVAASPTHVEETEFATALRKALNVVDSSATRPDDLSPDGLHRFTRTYLREHPWGNPLVAANGGTAGINTSGVSESIHEIAKKFLPVSVVPILDLRLSRTSNALLSMGSTTHGGEIFIGTQRQIAGSVGAGFTGSIGPDALKKILGQGTASAGLTPLAVESVRTRGVMVRMLRPPKTDRSGQDSDAARNELVRFNDLMWSVAKGEHGKLTPEQSWELIADRFFDSPTLSIGWQDQDATTVHHALNVSLGARVGHSIGRIAGAFAGSETERLAVAGGLSADVTTFGSNRRSEQTGRNRLVRANYLWRFQTNLTMGATQTNPPIPASHATGPVTASIASGPTAVTRIYAVDDRGFNATFRAILKSGKLSEPYTLREFEERNAKAFVAFLSKPERRLQFLQVFKGAYGEEKGEQEFENFLTKARSWAGPGQHYVTRYRIRAEDRAALDELAAVAHCVGERDPANAVVSSIRDAMRARLESEDAWIPIQTFSLEGQVARETLGVNLGVQFSAQDSVLSDRELSAVVVPLPIAEAWARERRDMERSNSTLLPTSEDSSQENRRAGS